MEIIIKDQEEKLILSDDSFDVNGWVRLCIDNGRGDSQEIDIHVNDLYPAALAFMEKYKNMYRNN